MVSEEGLNAYGAITWGQFFVYQGFNERAGWMHTSSRADAIDWYLEDVFEKDDGVYYRYGDGERKLEASTVTIPYKDGSGMAEKTFTVYHSHHGPIISEQDGKWVSIKLMEEPVKALTQSYLRTKVDGHDAYWKTMELLTNSSNNTVYADADGNIAYFHGNFVPRRDPSFDWSQPVDGSDPATEWQGLHPVEEQITLLNPPSGYIQNTNNWPFSAAGPSTAPSAATIRSTCRTTPRTFAASTRWILLEKGDEFTLDSLIAMGYDSYLTGFEKLVPSLVNDPVDDPLKAELSEQIEALRGWDLRWSEARRPKRRSPSTGETSCCDAPRRPRVAELEASSRFDPGIYDYAASDAASRHRLEALKTASDTLEADFGDWRTAWGEINRYQRLTGDIVQKFDDDAPSLPVGFASGRWGALASYGSRTYPGHQADVRHRRQQLRRRGRVRRAPPRQSRHRGRAEQRPRLASFRRSSRALRERRVPRRVVLPRRRGKEQGARVPPRAVACSRVSSIDLARIRSNAELMTAVCSARGVDVMGVTKGVGGDVDVARALVAGGVTSLGDARLENLRALQKRGARSPPVAHPGAEPERRGQRASPSPNGSFHSELQTLRARRRRSAPAIAHAPHLAHGRPRHGAGRAPPGRCARPYAR